ncbi:RelA/SpoT domain-containing protein [Methylobacterium variabile]|uniref:RelA/SpoT domain-containing protein n=1 Tax=Methylobacterium variabile TaxID=298794 RepID=UPI001428CC03|nr:RelA/SpoT domain-containing protein [Methylobacterium variabile]
MRDVRRAGEIITGDLIWKPETENEIRSAFSIANNWRDSHAYPMRSIRFSLLIHIRNQKLAGFSAARLKRMQAIRRKLRKMQARGKPLNLNQLQDLGGCRAIMRTMDDVNRLVEGFKEKSKHEFRGENNYIISPKDDGYRSHHLKYAFRGTGELERHNGRRIEIQVRTMLQHSWATAIEAVGLFRGEDLKGSDGSTEWLRLFQLMSAEFAEAEGCLPPPGMPSREARVQELKGLSDHLDALNALESLSHATQWDLEAIRPRDKPTHYLIKYNRDSRRVEVLPYYRPVFAVAAYDDAENSARTFDSQASNIVLVEVDKIDNLKMSYPNYFGDVQTFRKNLSLAVTGKSIEEYAITPQAVATPRPVERIDPSWLRSRGRWT